MKKLRKLTGVLLCLFLLTAVPIASVYAEPAAHEETTQDLTQETTTEGASEESPETRNQIWPTPPETEAESVFVEEVSTSSVLYEKEADTRRYPASTTKILTALLAIEHCELTEEVTFSKAAITLEDAATNIKAQKGEKMPMRDVLFGLMLASGNDCANAIAEHVAGSVSAFADLMNARAKEIGCTDSHFVNPHGLFDDNHYTTARDLALIAQEAFKNSTFVEIISTAEYTADPTNKDPDPKTFYNTNLLLDEESDYYDPDVIGGKTGYLDESGRCLVTFAERNGFQLIFVELKGGYTQIFGETKKLADFTFDHFCMRNAAANDRRFSTPVEDARISLDPSAQVLSISSLPFEQLESKLLFAADMDIERRADLQTKAAEQPGRSIYAVIDYSYAGHTLGSANVYLDESLVLAPAAFTRIYYISPLYLVLFVLVVLILVIFAYAQKKKPKPLPQRRPAYAQPRNRRRR